MRTKAENFRNAPKPNFDVYVTSFICTNFEAFTTFSAIFTRIRCTIINCQQTSIEVNYIQQILIGYVFSYLFLKLRPQLHGYIFKSFRFHFIAFSNRSTLDSLFKCLSIQDHFHRFHVNWRWNHNDIIAFSNEMCNRGLSVFLTLVFNYFCILDYVYFMIRLRWKYELNLTLINWIEEWMNLACSDDQDQLANFLWF